MAFSTKECAWSQVSLKILGATITGLRGFEFKKTTEKELVFAAGQTAVDITEGNKSASGNLLLLKYEFDKINDAAQLAGFDDITEVPFPSILITCAFKISKIDPIRIIETPLGVAFTDLTIAMQQNAKMMEVPLPWIAQKVLLRKG
jgi:hypothetical protein